VAERGGLTPQDQLLGFEESSDTVSMSANG